MNNKIAFVTGANSGIGKATALALASKGATVVLGARREEATRQAVDEIIARGGKADAVKLDVGNEDSVKASIEYIMNKYGKLDLAVNNAGISQMPTSLVDTDAALLQSQLQTNVLGVFLSMKYELMNMQQNGGSIVNISSINGIKAMTNAASYSASKFAVETLTKTAALEWADKGVRINSVAPGPTQTELVESLGAEVASQLSSVIPMKRLATTQEISNGVLWLLSDEASFVTGSTLVIDGGFTA